MANYGPVPKRDSERAGHKAKSKNADHIKMEERVTVPPPDHDWANGATDWYLSLAKSGQSRYFEPSDWQHARYVARLLTQNENADRPSAELAKVIASEMGKLGTTEADRRRMRIEVDRDSNDESEADEAAEVIAGRFDGLRAVNDGG